MDVQLLKKYGGNVPRYTSYPTAAQFTETVEKESHAWWLWRTRPDEPVSLYFHIPFCDRLCWYCACHTNVTKKYHRITDYLTLLKKEIPLVCRHLKGRPGVSQIHWGGGTPNLLKAGDFKSLLELIGQYFEVSDDAEHAMEIDPRSLKRQQAFDFIRAGVNRVSLGIQDFDPEVQKAINRVQPFDMVAAVMGWLREAGIESINFDLIYGLPRQTVASIKQSLEQSISLEPDRLAVFGYAHVPWMKTHQKMIRKNGLPGPAERLEMAEVISQRLKAAGYVKIGLDHFARPGDPLAIAQKQGTLHRNFQGYTTDRAKTILGFGASAISQFPGGFVQNLVDFKKYREAIKAGELPSWRGVIVTDEDRLHWAVIEALMCYQRVDLEPICQRFQVRADTFLGELKALKPFIKDHLVVRTGNRLEITEEGAPFLRSVAAVFDQHFKNKNRHSQAI